MVVYGCDGSRMEFLAHWNGSRLEFDIIAISRKKCQL